MVGHDPLPLHGVRVVDLSRAMAGPYCTAILGDLGATIIKVEGLPKGDSTRKWSPKIHGESLYYASINRNKRSLALDLRSAGAKEVLHKLLSNADVLIQNFRPGTLAEMGLEPDRLRRDYPQLILSSLSGYGEIGPMRKSPGYDQIAQGMSGLMSVTGIPGQGPVRSGVPIADITAGLFSAIGILAAMVARHDGRRSHHMSTSLLESSIALMPLQAQAYLATGAVSSQNGNDHPSIAPYGTYTTADGQINIAAVSDQMFQALCEAIDMPEVATDPSYSSAALRFENRQVLNKTIENALRTNSRPFWIERLRSVGIPCGPIYRIDETFADEQVKALQLAQVPLERSEGEPLMRGPLWVDGQPTPIRLAPPKLGENTVEILQEVGFSASEIDTYCENGVVVQADLFK